MFDKRPRTTFRELFAGEQVFTPCVWDCYSAKAAEMAGASASSDRSSEGKDS